MPLPILPKVNGQSYQHANVAPVITLESGGRVPLSVFKSISYKDGAKKKSVKDSQGRDTGGWTLGQQEKEGAAIEILMTEWRDIKRILSRAYPLIGVGQIVMNWNVSYGNTIDTLITDQLIGVMFDEDARDSSDSQDALYIKVPLFIGGDIIDGATGKPFIIYGP